MSKNTLATRNINNAKRLLKDAMPDQNSEWIESGWKPLSTALSEQTSEATDIVASDDTVLMKFHMTALHTGTIRRAPATGKRVQ